MPECEIGTNNRDLPFHQPWLKNAIPSENGKFESCNRYALKNETIFESANQCNADMFDKSMKIKCTEYIHESDEKNVQTEVNLLSLNFCFVTSIFIILNHFQ